MSSSPKRSSVIDFDSPRIQRYNRIRHLKDKVASVAVAVGGNAVICAILLIFIYLLYEVIPMFQSANVEEEHSYQMQGVANKTLYFGVEEQNEVALRVTD